MAPLIRLAIVVSLLAATPARGDTVNRWRPIIAEASARFGVPESWIERVVRAESAGYDRLNGRPTRSPKGAMGLMQLMPATWASVRSALALGTDPDDPHDNILAGTFYLRQMYDRFGYPGCFAAYNAGPGRYAAALAGRRALPNETVSYLATVGGTSNERAAPGLSRTNGLFAIGKTIISASTAGEGSPDATASLFAIRREAK